MLTLVSLKDGIRLSYLENFHFSNLLAASEAGCWKFGGKNLRRHIWMPLRKIGPIMHHSVSSTEDKGIFSFYNADISCDISPRRSLKYTYVTFQTTNLLLKQKNPDRKNTIFICILNCVRWVMNFPQRYSKSPEQKALNIISSKVIAAKIVIQENHYI